MSDEDSSTANMRAGSDLLTLKEELTRIYDLTKWFIGRMFTMAMGLIASHGLEAPSLREPSLCCA